MFANKLVCRKCGKEYNLEELYSCTACDNILEVKYNSKKFKKDYILNGSPEFDQGMWKYFNMLPVKDSENVVTIGEGNTPLIKEKRIPDLWKSEISLYIKAESLNPSGSFKDRPTSVGISVAKELGRKTVVVSSSGNASASVAAYAARTQMRCIVFIPETTDPNKVIQAYSYGAEIIGVKGNFSSCFKLAKEISKKFGWTNLVSTFLNPYTVEANKTIAYELYTQLKGYVPDYITIPIGSGPLLVGIFKGYKEMVQMGLIKKLPKMIGVQVKECEPITQAFFGNYPVASWSKPVKSIAGGISDPLIGYEKDGDLTIDVIKESKGTMVSLNEQEVIQCTNLIEKTSGLYTEPTGAVSVGAVEKLYNAGFIVKGSSVVSIVTGHGFKFSKRDIKKLNTVETVEQVLELL